MGSELVLKKEDTILSIKMSDRFSSKKYDEKTTNYSFDILEGEERQISLDGVRIFLGNLKINNPLILETKSDFPFLSISFELGGDSFYTPKENCTKSISMSIKKDNYNFFYMPKIDGTATIKGKNRKYFILLFTEKYIKSLFKNNFSELSSEFEKALQEETPYLMFTESQPIPFKLLELVNEIKDCYYQNNIKEVFVQSKVMEMFVLIFSELEASKKAKQIKKKDLEILINSETTIQNNLHKHLTLSQISYRVGTNQSKLKEIFSLVYNETVFEYSSRLRMEKAKQLLMIDKTISEVSSAVGYKNPQHFSTAFKKRFNYLPSEFKKEYEFIQLKLKRP